ncbi:MAG: hypothetical protein VKJ05_07960 [Synechococcaceae cyanobacterium]|nr:hypothetical protein [Synechococcaceae cyanobacterium]
MTPTPPDPASRRARWVAIITGALSILVAVLYLAFVTLLDSRGPLLPPPPEAFADAVPGGRAIAVPITPQAGAAAAAPSGAAVVPPPG